MAEYQNKNNTMKKYIIATVVVLAAGIGAFYGGMTYGKSQASIIQDTSRNFPAGSGQNFQRSITDRNGGAGGGFISGQIIAADSQSITVEFRNSNSTNSASSTKIVFLSDSTPVMKTVSGTIDDLTIGENVTVVGTPSSDGSITAQSIQIRPTNGLEGNPRRQTNPQP